MILKSQAGYRALWIMFMLLSAGSAIAYMITSHGMFVAIQMFMLTAELYYVGKERSV